MANLWLTKGSVRWTGAVWRNEPVHLSEPFQTHIIQILIYRGVHYFVKPSKRMVWFLVRPWSEPISLLQSVPQGLVLGPAVFNIYLSDLFLILNDIDIVCYDDDNTQYKACDNVDAVFKTLKMSVEKLFKRFKDNQMKGRTDKCHQILSTGDSN